MQISILLAQQIAQLFLILIMGYAVVKAGLLKASDSRVLSVVMVYLVTPCVIINAFQIDDTPEIRKGLLYSMAIAAAIHVVLLVLSALLSRPLKLDAVEQVNVIYSNAAALVIPLVKALMGDAYVIYSCAFIIVQLVLLWVCHASSWVADGKNILMTVYLAAITPACATVTSMAQLYDRDAAHSSALYVLTTLLSIVSMPVMIGLFDLLL